MAFQANPQSSVPEQYQTKFASTWERQVQQENEVFAARGMIASDWTETHYQDTDMTSPGWVETTGQRFRISNPSEITTGNRHGFRRKADFQVWFDRLDNQYLSALGQPTSEVMMDARAKLKALKDTWFLEAAIATAKTGPVTAMVDVVFPTANVIAVNFVLSGAVANKGMTPHKLLEAVKQFMVGNIDPTVDTIYVSMSPKQVLDLYVYAETYTNDTYASSIVGWLDGKTDKLFGTKCQLLISNNLTLDTTTDIRTCVVFCDRGFKLSPMGMETKFDTLANVSHAQQISMYANGGCFRRKDEYVRKILCDESP